MHTISFETYVTLRKLVHVSAQLCHPCGVTKTEKYNHGHNIVTVRMSYCIFQFHLPDIPRTAGDKIAKPSAVYLQPVNENRKTLAAVSRNKSSLSGGREHTLTSKLLTVKYGRSLKSFEFETSQPTTQTSRQTCQQSFSLQVK
jgi:hypothetical protein